MKYSWKKCKLVSCVKKAKIIFCSMQCSRKYHNELWSSKVALQAKEDRGVSRRIACIGINCRGEKMFMSHSKFDRVCSACQKVQNGMDMSYVFSSNSRTSKVGR